MIVAKIQVTGAIAHTVYRKVIPAGVIGAQVEFEYAEDVWSGLHKTVIFRGHVTKDVVTDDNIVTIPPEVVEKSLPLLSVGVYGVDTNGNIAIPTIWADLGSVRDAANPSGDTTTDPSLPVWAQIKQIADEAKQQARSVRNDADSGVFDGADGHTPVFGVDYGTPEQISGIAQQAAEVLQPELNHLKDDLSAEQTARENAVNAMRADLIANTEVDSDTRRKLDCLWKLNQGISYQFETDGTEAYSKIVPSGSKLASVKNIDGKTVVWNQLLAISKGHGSNTGVSFEVSDTKVTAVGTAVDAVSHQMLGNARFIAGHTYLLFGCPGGGGPKKYMLDTGASIGSDYGLGLIGVCKISGIYYIGIYIYPAAGEVKLTFKPRLIDLTILFGEGNEPSSTNDPRIAWIEQYAEANPAYNAGELVSAKVESVKYNDAVISDIPAAIRSLPGYGWSAGDVWNAIEWTETGWQYVQRVGSRAYQEGDIVTDGVTTYYALENPVITDITELMTDFQAYFEVGAGGTITMENAAMLPVPSTEKYLIALAEVNG